MKRSSFAFISLFFLIISIFALSIILFSCGNNGSAPSGTSSSSTTTATESKLSTVESGLIPSSMVYSSSSSDSFLNIKNSDKKSTIKSTIKSTTKNTTNISIKAGSDPCTGYSYMGCQPVLLRLYMNMAKTFMRVTRLILNKMGEKMGSIADGASGTLTLADSSTLTYSKIDTNNFSVLLKDANGNPSVYLTLVNGVVTLKTSLQYVPSTIRTSMGADAPTTNEKIQVTLNYTDSNNWTLDSRIAGMACTADDIGAPNVIVIKVNKSNGVWSGKAMLNSPRWNGISSSYTCDTTPTNSTSVCIYTDFVANNTAAKANVYMLARNETTISSNYIINKWCDNYASTLYGGNTVNCTNLFKNSSTGAGTSTDYVSPFCMNPVSGVPVASWNNNCSSLDTTISGTEFGANSDWIAPADIYSLDITIPASL
ncbi:MAG: hypothetical protein HQK49_18445 [Oligoflexia bacterium]|nr:hypothetical protein [Oligoflexia bacterium]